MQAGDHKPHRFNVVTVRKQDRVTGELISTVLRVQGDKGEAGGSIRANRSELTPFWRNQADNEQGAVHLIPERHLRAPVFVQENRTGTDLITCEPWTL